MDQRWQDVHVGDFVRLSCNEIIPADMLLLYSSDLHGVCYIETANLDGETNLKQRQVVRDLPQVCGSHRSHWFEHAVIIVMIAFQFFQQLRLKHACKRRGASHLPKQNTAVYCTAEGGVVQ